MLSYLLLFVVFIFFIRVPLFLLRLVFRFSKPLALIGFGCIIGVCASTGWPDLSEVDSALTNSTSNSRPSDLTDTDEPAGPKLLEAALGLADEARDSLSSALAEVQASWNRGSDKKIASTRSTATGNFASLSGSLWDRKQKPQ